jgi:thiamine kinase-like enzyme
MPPPVGNRTVPQKPEDITVSWLTSALRAGGLDVTVASLTAQPVEQAFGVQSLIVRYEITYAGKPQGPSSVVAKLETPAPANRQHNATADLWERETRFYRDIGPHIGVRVPRCYFVAADSDRHAHALILEDLGGREQPPQLSLSRAATAVRWLAGLHGRWWDRVAVTFPWLETELSFERRMRAAVEANWSAYLKLAESHHIPIHQIAMVEESVLRFGEGLTGGLLAPTLIHYDYRVGNMLFKNDDDLVVFDWQSPLVGQATVDLGWFIKDSITAVDRRAHEKGLIRLYLDELVLNGVDRQSLDFFDRQMRLSHLRRLPMSVLLATTFANLAHADDDSRPVWWAKDYDELEALWHSEGKPR